MTTDEKQEGKPYPWYWWRQKLRERLHRLRAAAAVEGVADAR